MRATATPGCSGAGEASIRATGSGDWRHRGCVWLPGRGLAPEGVPVGAGGREAAARAAGALPAPDRGERTAVTADGGVGTALATRSPPGPGGGCTSGRGRSDTGRRQGLSSAGRKPLAEATSPASPRKAQGLGPPRSGRRDSGAWGRGGRPPSGFVLHNQKAGSAGHTGRLWQRGRAKAQRSTGEMVASSNVPP